VKVTVLSSSGQSVKSGSTDGSKEGLTHGPSAKESATVQSQLTALKKEKSLTGKVLFTHFGVTGPTILNLSKTVSDALAYNDVHLSLDLKPSLDHGQLNTLLLTYIDSHKNKLLKNMLAEMLPVAIIKEVLTAAQIPLDIECHSLTRDMRMAIIQSIKGLTMKVKGLLGDDKAIVSSGGVTLAEIDTRTMCSRKIKQLYVVGDMLDIDRPSGGYSLQLCWTTGFVAGECV
jgi:predicted Rossmann fold flavoprotein